MEKNKYKCIKSVIMDVTECIAFTEGNVYQTANPEVWPAPSIKHCLIDNSGEDHFFTSDQFTEFFAASPVIEQPENPDSIIFGGKNSILGRDESLKKQMSLLRLTLENKLSEKITDEIHEVEKGIIADVFNNFISETLDYCPKCKSTLEIKNTNELYCPKCIHYRIAGIWKKIWCNEYHQHHSGCLVEIDELNKVVEPVTEQESEPSDVEKIQTLSQIASELGENASMLEHENEVLHAEVSELRKQLEREKLGRLTGVRK